jgi:hypothetical protein
VIADTTGLQGALNLLTTNVGLKADRIVPAAVGNLAGLNALGNLTDSGFAPSAFALSTHVHLISEVTNLQTELNNRALTGHTHIIADTTGLQTALNNKADFNHTHTIANVTNLQTTLDGKASVSHTHTIIDVSGLQEALEDRALLVHTHAISDVLNLQTTLNGKADVLHAHAIADITNLQTTLNGKAATVHTHVAADVTDFGESVDDRVASLLQAGSGITLQYLDGGNQLVIASSAVGSAPLLVTGYSTLGALQSNWSSSSVSFGTAFIASTSGTGTPVSPGSVTLSLKPLQFFEGPNLRSTYPNPAPGNVQTTVVFGAGLAATVSGPSSEVLTVTSVAPSALDGLDDVVLSAPSTGQVLMYNGTEWVNAPASGALLTHIVSLGDVPLSTFVFRSEISEMSFYSTYQSYLGGYSAPWTGTFDVSTALPGIVLNNPKDVYLDSAGETSILGTVKGDVPNTPPELVCEFVLTQEPSNSRGFYVGLFTQAYGPAYDAGNRFGGPLSSYYYSENNGSEIAGYGGTTSLGLPIWQLNDVIGVVWNHTTSQVAFFRNGTLVGTANMSNNVDVFPMCGIYQMS